MLLLSPTSFAAAEGKLLQQFVSLHQLGNYVLEVPCGPVKSIYTAIQPLEADTFLSEPQVSLLKEEKLAQQKTRRRLPGTGGSGHGKLRLHDFWFSAQRSPERLSFNSMPVLEWGFLAAVGEWNLRNYHRLPGSLSFTLLLLLSCIWSLQWPNCMYLYAYIILKQTYEVIPFFSVLRWICRLMLGIEERKPQRKGILSYPKCLRYFSKLNFAYLFF